MTKLAAAGALCLLLTACGFHLRQPPDLPPSMREIYVAAPGQSGQLVRELRRNLASDSTQVLSSPEHATATLSIISVDQSSRPLAVDVSGNPLEYQVTYSVSFSLIVEGVTVMEPQTLTLNRDYAYSVANAVANQEQEQALNRAMAKDVAQFITFRLVAAAKNMPRALATAVAPVPTTRPAPVAGTTRPPVTATLPPPAV